MAKYQAKVVFFSEKPSFSTFKFDEKDEVNFGKLHVWGDIKLVDPQVATNGPNDKVLWIGARVQGVKALEVQTPQGLTISEDLFPVRVYRMYAKDVSDSDEDIRRGLGLQAGAPIVEPPGRIKLLKLVSYDPQGTGAAFYLLEIDLGAEGLIPPQGDDKVPEIAVFDFDALFSQANNEADGYEFSKFMKARGFISRGLAHPRIGGFRTPATAAGDERWGRPLANQEFVFAGGVEKIVVTALPQSGGNVWLQAGEMEETDHALVKSPADIVFLSGHGHGDQFAGASGELIFSQQLSFQWNRDGENQKFEVEWLILVGCSLLDDGNDIEEKDAKAYKWGKAMLHDNRLQGFLGFGRNGWTGQDWMQFLDQGSNRSQQGKLEPLQIKLAQDAPAGDKETKLEDVTMLVGDKPLEEIPDGLDVNFGDEIDLGNEVIHVTDIKVDPSTISLRNPLAGNHKAGEIGSVRVSITRAWRAWMRTRRAFATNLRAGREAISTKEPAYLVYKQFHDTVFFDVGSQNSVSDTDPDPKQAQPVVYWESGSKETLSGKDEETERSYERTYP
ncbi:MAG: hypothetical protein HYU36_22775 [Planctomycetes bacterium]|nr:hypothetical protein [Planctomycetota bacterium]